MLRQRGHVKQKRIFHEEFSKDAPKAGTLAPVGIACRLRDTTAKLHLMRNFI
jgi:hypothetical protein